MLINAQFNPCSSSQVEKGDYIDKIKNILWKYDSELGIAYFCPECKKFLCSEVQVCECGQEISWENPKKYKGKVKW